MANGNGKHPPTTCGALLKRCRNCNYKYTKDDTANKVEACPTCGVARGRCENTTLIGQTGRCLRHGGANLSGIAHPSYQGKGYSKYLPQRVQADYTEALNDPALIELRSELALIEARMGDVLRQLHTGESGSTWRTAQTAMRDLLVALQLQPPDPNAQALALSALRTAIDKGSGDYALWDELGVLIERKRRIVDTETRRTIAAKQFITLDKVGLLFDALATVVISEVQDRSTLARIQRAWYRLYSGAGGAALSTGEPDDEREPADADESA